MAPRFTFENRPLHWFSAYVCLQTLLVLAWYYWKLRHSIVDDAFISFTYARNLLQGNGLTWDGVYVEGYTNFFFLLLLAALHFLTGISFVSATYLINGAAYLGILALTLRIFRHLPSADPPLKGLLALMGIALTVTSLPLVAWIFGGLESLFFAFLCALCLYQTLFYIRAMKMPDIKASLALGLLLALASLTRPEGFLITGFCGVWLYIIALYKKQHRHLLPPLSLWAMAACWLLIIVPYLTWKQQYYGDLLPNTFYAKCTGLSPRQFFNYSIRYIFYFFCNVPLAGFVILPAAFYLLARRTADITILFLLSFILFYFAYSYSAGGDYMAYFRFLLPVVIAITWLSFHVLIALSQHFARFSREIAVALTLLGGLQAMNLNSLNEDLAVVTSSAFIPIIAERLPAGSLIALDMAGSLPYYLPQYHYIDMLGLNDRYIARQDVREDRHRNTGIAGHMKGSGKYVLDRDPDIIIMTSGLEGKPRHRSNWQLIDDPRFARDYQRILFYPGAAMEKRLNLQPTPTPQLILGFYIHNRMALYFKDMLDQTPAYAAMIDSTH